MEKTLIVGVSGVRGVYPAPLSPDVVYRFGTAFGAYVQEKKIFVARDTRESGPVLKLALTAGLAACGKDIADMDIASTPQLTYIVEKSKEACGVVISASHNPAEYNGLKFVSYKGTFLNSREGEELMAIYAKTPALKLPLKPGNIAAAKEADYREQYFNDIYRNIDAELVRKKKFRVAVDVCHGAGAFYTRSFLENLGCEVIVINDFPAGVFSHNPEPLPANLTGLSQKMVQEKADAGFAQDPDADRLALACENGALPGEEMTLALAIENVLEKKTGPVTVNLSTSSLAEYIAGKFGVKVHRTKIGEVHVVEKMKQTGAVIGGEGNGGVIFPDIHYGRDSFAGMALILEYMAKRGRTLSQLVNEFPKYTMLKEKFVVTGKRKDKIIEELKKIYCGQDGTNTEDGIKIIKQRGWIHVRPSGTEPILRVYIEGENAESSRSYLAEIKKHIPA